VNPVFTSTALAWLLTYAIHSSVLLGLVWLITRSRRIPPMATDLLWKVALVGGVLTAALQQRFDLRPSGTMSLPGIATAASPAPIGGVTHPGVTPELARGRVGAPRGSEPGARRPGSAVGALSGEQSTASSVRLTTVALAAWGTVALLLSLLYAGRRLILVGRLGDRQAVRDDRLLKLFASLRREVGHARPVRLTCTSSISSPVALGLSEICLPAQAISDLDVEQQRGMLAHELAHLGRRDPLWLDLASIVERVFFFQPLNRLARREMETAAEYLCDEWAMRKTGSGLHLARCLAKVAEWIQASPLGVPVAGMAEQRSLLVSRIARLLDGGPTGSNRSRRGAAATALILLIGMIAITPGVSGRARRSAATSADTGERTVGEQPLAPRQASPATSGSPASGAMQPRGRRAADSGQPADSAVVSALIARLKDEDARVRRAAARSLGQLEDRRAVTPLIETLKDPDDEVRAAAADALAEFEDPRAIEPLTLLLADPSTDVKHNALDGLSRFEHGVPVAPVVRALGDSNAEVRGDAVHLLEHLGDRSAASAIARLIHDGSSDVRSAAVSALGRLGDAGSGAALQSALGDPSAEVRQNALEALGELKIGIPEPLLLTLLHDSKADVRQAAAELAGRRSIVAAIPALKQLVDDPKADVRESAVEALGNMADPSAREALRAALASKDPKVRRAAAEALGERP
jgi:HEAT repeat protein/beta-lactamase regulating signal transducer with metallopeptidase domain